MKVVILCGGQGTRIRGVSDDVPKPMLPIGSLPILWHIMSGYATQGFREFVLCLGYKGHVIKDFFLNYQARLSDLTVDFAAGGKISIDTVRPSIDWKVSLVETGLDTMTGSRVKRIERWIGDDDTFMLTYGDGVSNVDVNALLDFHRRRRKLVTVSGVRPPGRFGELDHDAEGRLIEFNEKPQTTAGRISGGFFVCDRRLFQHLDEQREDQVLEVDPLQRLAREGQMVMYAHDGFWHCMDTFRDYQLLNDLYRHGKAPWVTW